MDEKETELRIEQLKSKLDELLGSNTITYSKIRKLTSPGVYVAYEKGKLIYLGKTKRKGKKRISEMWSDYRSHTLNNKFLKKLLNNKFNLNIKTLRVKSKQNLISKGVISEDRFKEAQREVNEYIRANFSFKFIPLSEEEINSFEYFAIGVLKPKYNA